MLISEPRSCFSCSFVKMFYCFCAIWITSCRWRSWMFLFIACDSFVHRGLYIQLLWWWRQPRWRQVFCLKSNQVLARILNDLFWISAIRAGPEPSLNDLRMISVQHFRGSVQMTVFIHRGRIELQTLRSLLDLQLIFFSFFLLSKYVKKICFMWMKTRLKTVQGNNESCIAHACIWLHHLMGWI